MFSPNILPDLKRSTLHKEQTITYMGPVVTSQKLSRTFYFDNKQKHQLVLRRTSWCFVLLWPRHAFTKYFARIIKIYQEQTITYMGPVVTSQKLSTTFYFDNKQKHELVLRRTSWCFDARKKLMGKVANFFYFS